MSCREKGPCGSHCPYSVLFGHIYKFEAHAWPHVYPWGGKGYYERAIIGLATPDKGFVTEWVMSASI